jgi:hypothetical protein
MEHWKQVAGGGLGHGGLHWKPGGAAGRALWLAVVAALVLPLVALAGSGNFAPHPTTPNFGTAYSWNVALGDLDGDEDLDAVIANSNDQAETVWLNDGAGTFSAHPITPSFGAGDSSDATLGDLDGDEDLDAVVANYYAQAETVWLNDGAGSFSVHSTTPGFGAGHSYDVTLGDLDGDEDPDAVVTNYNEAKTVWLNDGTGLPTAVTTSHLGANTTSPSAAGAAALALLLGGGAAITLSRRARSR